MSNYITDPNAWSRAHYSRASDTSRQSDRGFIVMDPAHQVPMTSRTVRSSPSVVYVDQPNNYTPDVEYVEMRHPQQPTQPMSSVMERRSSPVYVRDPRVQYIRTATGRRPSLPPPVVTSYEPPPHPETVRYVTRQPPSPTTVVYRPEPPPTVVSTPVFRPPTPPPQADPRFTYKPAQIGRLHTTDYRYRPHKDYSSDYQRSTYYTPQRSPYEPVEYDPCCVLQ